MYNKEKGSTVGCFDNENISRKYQIKVNGFRKALVTKLTPAEREYEERVAKLISGEARTPYIRERIFHITDQVAFIADFYFKKFKVAVEIDGGSHNGSRNKERDRWRDDILLEHAGVTVVRFSNTDVMERCNDTFNRTIRALGEAKNATPSHRKFLIKTYAHCF